MTTNATRTSGLFLLIIVVLSAAPLYAGDANGFRCTRWSSLPADESGEILKTSYLLGFDDGVFYGVLGGLAQLIQPGTSESVTRQKVENAVRMFWPNGLTAKELRPRLDAYCRKPDNKDVSIPTAIVEIAKTWNDSSK